MDQLKIGKFIAERRKSENLTQMQLAEKLSVTDRAISKWETGKSMPDSSIMLKLCQTLKISVTELLMGEEVSMDNNNEKFEEVAMGVVRQKERADKMLLALEWVVGILSILILLVPITIGSLIPEGAIEDWQRLLIVFSGFIPAIIGILFAVKIEQVAGYYKCGRCGHTYVPSYKAVNFAMHMGRTRYLKCPKCGKKSWQKKVVSKD
jgi:transcriptional regulator with XRE-family HTH domain/DNA-directed RNA polymerase subunit RPC12/RpoP